MLKYELIIDWSEADRAFIAEVPELLGCAADGKTYREALANGEIVVQEWLETATESGRSIPAPRGPVAVCVIERSRSCWCFAFFEILNL